MHYFRRNADGFTLIELIVVIAVLGILSTIAIPRLSGLQEKAKDAEIAQVGGSIRTAMVAYYQDNDTYPETDDIENWEDLKATLTVLDLTDMEDYNILDGSLEYESDNSESYEIKLTSESSGIIYSITDNDFGQSND